MVRRLFGKVMWLGRATSALVGLVVLFALAIGAANSALAHTNVDTKLFHLGHNNPVRALSALTGTLTGAVLKLDNNGTGTALQLDVGGNRTPLKVNAAAGTATNLSADELDGKDSGTYLPGDLPAGTTVRGNFYILGSPSANSEWFGDDISFGYRLPSVPTAHYIKDGEPVPAGCSGNAANPEAAPGHLCVFESAAVNVTADRDTALTSRQGSGLEIQSAVAGSTTYAYGTWAVTAP